MKTLSTKSLKCILGEIELAEHVEQMSRGRQFAGAKYNLAATRFQNWISSKRQINAIEKARQIINNRLSSVEDKKIAKVFIELAIYTGAIR